jgi:hypothetical protein
MSDITPEKVAVLLAEDDDNGFYSDKVGGWVTFEAKGASVQVKVAHHDEAGEEVPDQTQHFRAVVVEGEQAPIVLERPATLEKEWGPADEVRSWVSPDLFVVVNTMKTTNVGFLTPVEARRLAARLAALADEAQKLAGEEIARRRAEAAQAEQERAR